jgi:mono/diheme cytochrome c family protein
MVVCLLAASVVVAATAVAAFGGSSRSGTKVIGNVAAGKKVFATAGCVSCHTLKAAKATGKIGPNLDKLKPAYATIVKQVTNGGGVMPSFKGRLSKAQIQDVAAFVYTSTHK